MFHEDQYYHTVYHEFKMYHYVYSMEVIIFYDHIHSSYSRLHILYATIFSSCLFNKPINGLICTVVLTSIACAFMCLFYFCHCILYPSIYGFWLFLLYLQIYVTLVNLIVSFSIFRRSLLLSILREVSCWPICCYFISSLSQRIFGVKRQSFTKFVLKSLSY